MDVFVVSKAKPLCQAECIFVAKSMKVAEKKLRAQYPHMKPDGFVSTASYRSYYATDVFGEDIILVIRKHEVVE